jgi:hypothetical protein
MLQRVGIDPLGGTAWPIDGTGASIVWGSAREQYDTWGQFSVDVTAEAATITVYTFSDPMWPVRNNDVYWDDAALIELVEATMAVTPSAGFVFLADVDEPETLSRQLQIAFDPDNGYEWTATVDPTGTMVPTLSTDGGGSATPLVVSVDSAGLAVGTYSTVVTVFATGHAVGGSPVAIPVTLHVVNELSRSYLPVSVLQP